MKPFLKHIAEDLYREYGNRLADITIIFPNKRAGLFFNEYLKNELLEHKRVFEALGSRMSAEPDENQLSGLGFSETQRNELVVKVTGTTERMLKIKF